jgi:DNA-binding transcriptional LysR family regulator
MVIHQLEYFVAIVETGGFSRAAERCKVAQPSLSQQIKKLEQELGRPLFHLLGRKIVAATHVKRQNSYLTRQLIDMVRSIHPRETVL